LSMRVCIAIDRIEHIDPVQSNGTVSVSTL
jgi:hypothetical protein